MSRPNNKSKTWLQRYRESIFLIGGVLIGFLLIEFFFWIQNYGVDDNLMPKFKSRDKIPISVLPGPLRGENSIFELNPDQALKLTGSNDPENERWSDISGNYYSEKFISSFDYEGNDVQVLVLIEENSDTLRGRLEAKGLKPNFAYQIKLRGIFENFESFEKVGYAGRWRFPGKVTNFTDSDYQSIKDKSDVEAYILFDFFVTDKNGNAVRNFELDSSLHVLWNGSRQHGLPDLDDVLTVNVDASDPKIYSRPKKSVNIELLWAEREINRYSKTDQKRFLLPGKYEAELVLTEESFHSSGNDGGYWATVFKGNISFVIE